MEINNVNKINNVRQQISQAINIWLNIMKLIKNVYNIVEKDIIYMFT